MLIVTRLKSHNPYFNRWFSAISTYKSKKPLYTCHNPYFNRWFSAIYEPLEQYSDYWNVTILILIDGFLQSNNRFWREIKRECHNPYFNRWFSAISH